MEKDPYFWRKWPYGVLKTIQWAAPLALIITLVFAQTQAFSGIGVVWMVAFSFMLMNVAIWVCYTVGLQKRATHSVTQQSGNTVVYRFISFAALDFFVAAAGTVLFGICCLIGVIIFFYAIAQGYNASVAISFFFATIFSLISGAAHGYYAILMYRSCPNGLAMENLNSLIVGGTKIDHTVGIRPNQTA